eukprot:gene8484-11468_t
MMDYTFLEVLGEGVSGTVYKIQHKQTGDFFACKVMKVANNMNDHESLHQEISILKNCRHPNIVSIKEVHENEDEIKLIMAVGNSAMNSCQLPMLESQVIGIFHQILLAVNYLHKKGFAHRDLKLANIIIMEGNACFPQSVALTDFGLSTIVDLSRSNNEKMWKNKKYNKLKERWGTINHFAPEVIKSSYGPQAEVWALACILFNLLTGEKLVEIDSMFAHNDPNKKAVKKLQNLSKVLPSRTVWDKLSIDAQDLILQMIHHDPRKRYSVEECLNHPFFATLSYVDKMTLDSKTVDFDEPKSSYARWNILPHFSFLMRKKSLSRSFPSNTTLSSSDGNDNAEILALK